MRVGVLAVCAGPGPWGVEGWEEVIELSNRGDTLIALKFRK